MPLDTVIQKSKLRPTGAGKVLRKIVGKVIASVLKEDVIKCTGTVQVCAGQEAGIEPAIHSMNMMHEDENTNAILPVDGSNAFNYLNRQSFLHNISYLSPSRAIFVKNCYSTPSRLFTIREIEITSREGTTQGDPNGRFMAKSLNGDLWYRSYIFNNMLIAILSNEYSANVYAARNLQDLRRWWSVLTEICPKFGYCPEPTKSWLLVKPCVSEKV